MGVNQKPIDRIALRAIAGLLVSAAAFILWQVVRALTAAGGPL